ncbi:MAG: choice-of-anchor M domain-containing protein [Limisphaerales bacterium]
MKILKSVLKNALLVSCVAGVSVSASAATLSKGHADVGIAYEDGEWDLHVHDGERDKEYEPDDAVFRVNPGAQTAVPTHSSFSFLGNPGEPVWILPAVEDHELLFLGLGTEEIEAGVFVGNQVRLTLKGVTGPGHFALYTIGGFGAPTVRMNSRDGISDAADFINLQTGSHGHANWAFSAPGTYKISFEASGTLNDGNNTFTSSGPVEYTFNVIADTAKPSVAVVSPANNLRTNSPVVTISGTAKDNGKVNQVLMDFNGSGFQPLNIVSNTALVSWSRDVEPVPGTNVVLIKAIDRAGNESSVIKRTFFYVVTEQLTLTANGEGTFKTFATPLGTAENGATLEIGRPYKVQAIPGAHQVFSNWTGSVSSTSPVLNFIMESNMVLQANFIPNPFIPAAGVYNGLFRDEEQPVLHDNAGFITVKVTTNFGYSGKIQLDGNTVAFSGKFNLDGTVTRQVDRSKVGKSPLTLTLALDFANETDMVTGTLSSQSWTANIEADKALYSKINPTTNHVGNYTFSFGGFSDSSEGPGGYGYGAILVGTDGVAKLSGGLPDGVAAKRSVSVSKNGRWPVYIPLYVVGEEVNGKTLKVFNGSIMGWADFGVEGFYNSLVWNKKSWTNGFYDAGFSLENGIMIDPYTAPAMGQPALSFEQVLVRIGNGNIAEELSSHAVLTPKNALLFPQNPNQVALKITPKNGLMSGTFIHPVTSEKTTFKGAVLQNWEFGSGVFRGTNQTGYISLDRIWE